MLIQKLLQKYELQDEHWVEYSSMRTIDAQVFKNKIREGSKKPDQNALDVEKYMGKVDKTSDSASDEPNEEKGV